VWECAVVKSQAEEYRQYALECIESANAAASVLVRQQFLELAGLWLNAASRLESGVVLSPDDVGEPKAPFAYRPPQKPAA
jgi:hypothetical protein